MFSVHLEGPLPTLGQCEPSRPALCPGQGEGPRDRVLHRSEWAGAQALCATSVPSWKASEAPIPPSGPSRWGLPNLLNKCLPLISNITLLPNPVSYLRSDLSASCPSRCPTPPTRPQPPAPGTQLCQQGGGGGLRSALAPRSRPHTLAPSPLLKPPAAPQGPGPIFCPSGQAFCLPHSSRKGARPCHKLPGERPGRWAEPGPCSLRCVLCWHLEDSCFSRAKEPPPPPTRPPAALLPPQPCLPRAEPRSHGTG